MWAVAGFRAYRRRGRLGEALTMGGAVACVTFAVFVVARLITVNLTLETTSQRLDWQSLLARFEASGFRSLRAYANYEYITGAPFKIAVASVIGATMGVVGGLVCRTAKAR